jgi:hypothetical protein
MYASNYFMDNGIQQGIEIWSYHEQAEMRDRIANTMERATNGRLRVSSHEWPNNTTAPEQVKDINLVIGRLK